MADVQVGLSAARTALAEALEPVLGETFKIFPSPQSTGTITEPTLLLMRTRVEKLPAAPLGFHLNTFTLWVIDSYTNTEYSEDSLDLLLEEVLEALDETARVNWTDAERDMWSDSNPAYKINLTAHSNRKA